MAEEMIREEKAEVVEPEASEAVEALAEEKPDDTEKQFTQEDVDRIVRERLKRSREGLMKAEKEALSARTADVDRRENRLSCREYLLDNGYPLGLLDVIETGDVKEFKEKVDKVNDFFANRPKKFVAPLASTEGTMHNRDAAFSRDYKHTPKFRGVNNFH